MLYYNGYYYLTATTWSSSATVGVTMKKGATINELKNATPQRIFYDTTSSRCCNIWAPEFHLLNGPNGQRWYLYYVAGVSANTDSQRIYVAESAGTDPLGPANPLVFAVGPLTGSRVPMTGRHHVAAISPLTALRAE